MENKYSEDDLQEMRRETFLKVCTTTRNSRDKRFVSLYFRHLVTSLGESSRSSGWLGYGCQ